MNSVNGTRYQSTENTEYNAQIPLYFHRKCNKNGYGLGFKQFPRVTANVCTRLDMIKPYNIFSKKTI